MTDAVQGKVARIVSDREVILNRGSADGVRQGMYFAVMDPNPVEVNDPETDLPIGSFKRVKITLIADQVSEHLTLATTFRTKTVNIGGGGAGSIGSVTSIFGAPKYVERVEKLRVDPNHARPLDEEESIVQVGDPFETISKARAEAGPSVSVWE